jgi:signal transduction histidine kinase
VLLAAEIEDAVESELEQAEMAARQDRFVDAQQVVDAHLRPESVPTVVISVDPTMRQRWRIDRTRTKKVLCKLLNNALRYNIAKGGLVEVKVRMHPGSESQVDITIADTGIGMSKSFVNNELSKVSGSSGMSSRQALIQTRQPFVKGGDGFSQGIGLGFTIASSLVAQMSGRLHVHSTPGIGTRVLVTLPLSLPLSSAAVEPPPRRRDYCVQK